MQPAALPAKLTSDQEKPREFSFYRVHGTMGQR